MDAEFLDALAGLTTAFRAIESISGASDQPFGNSALLEIRNEIAHLIRRTSNMALLHGVLPSDVERVRNEIAGARETG